MKQRLNFSIEAGRNFFKTLGRMSGSARAAKGFRSSPVYATTLVNLHVHERGSVVFPRDVRAEGLFSEREANLEELAWRRLPEHFQLQGERHDEQARILGGKLIRAALAVLHAPNYQVENASALSADWAHLPVPKNKEVFEKLTEFGEKISILLDPNRDAASVVESILGHDRTATLGPLRHFRTNSISTGFHSQ